MTLRRLLMLSIAVLLLIPSMGLGEEGKDVTTKGEVLDLACYVSHDQHGEDHAKCATKCVKGGQPMGLLAEDGTVYVLFADHGDSSAYEMAKEKAGQTVEISGTLSDKSGVKGLTVQGVKGS